MPGPGEFPAAPAEGAEPPGAPRAAPGRGNQGLDGARGRWHRTVGCSGGAGTPLVLLPLLKEMLNVVKLQLTPGAEQRLQTLCNSPLQVPASQHACSSRWSKAPERARAGPGAVPSSKPSIPMPRSLPCPWGRSVRAQSLRAAGTGPRGQLHPDSRNTSRGCGNTVRALPSSETRLSPRRGDSLSCPRCFSESWEGGRLLESSPSPSTATPGAALQPGFHENPAGQAELGHGFACAWD